MHNEVMNTGIEVRTDFGSHASETKFRFSASTAVVLEILLGSGTAHILLPFFNQSET